jgi:hypothetical protein
LEYLATGWVAIIGAEMILVRVQSINPRTGKDNEPDTLEYIMPGDPGWITAAPSWVDIDLEPEDFIEDEEGIPYWVRKVTSAPPEHDVEAIKQPPPGSSEQLIDSLRWADDPIERHNGSK